MLGRLQPRLIHLIFLALAWGLLQASALPLLAAAGPERRIVINIPSRTLWLYEGDRIIKWFPVGVGRPGFMTPLGQFKILRMVENPGWEHPYQAPGKIRIAPGENNPLGTRWMGFHRKDGGEYGMHGTDNPASVGRFSSHGCVRLKTPDAETLFSMVKIGTPVEVTYETVLIRPQGNQLRVVVYRDAFGRGQPDVQAVIRKVRAQYPEAVIDMAQLKRVLAQPNERPQVVGLVHPEEPAPPVARQTLDPMSPKIDLRADPMTPPAAMPVDPVGPPVPTMAGSAP